MNEYPTICAKCVHLVRVADGPRTGIWYNLLCGNTYAKKPEMDFVTGEFKLPYARDINPTGKCRLYMEK